MRINNLRTSNAVYLIVRVLGVSFKRLSARINMTERALRSAEHRAKLTPAMKRKLEPLVAELSPELFTSRIGRAVYEQLRKEIVAPPLSSLTIEVAGGKHPDNPILYLHRALGISVEDLARLMGLGLSTVRAMVEHNVRKLHDHRAVLKRALRQTIQIMEIYYPELEEQIDTLRYMIKHFDKIMTDVYRRPNQ